MARRTTMAGGCFLTVFILGGFVAGIAIHNPMKGVLLGLAAGAVVASGVWLVDRWRG